MAPPLTIQQVIDTIFAQVPGAPVPETVDTVKTGDPSRPVTGIVTTFLATWDVIERAAALGANMIITHEPTFYSHLDTTDWLENDPVYRAKRELIERHGIVIWRFHDHWHMHRPDGIVTGMVKTLGWEGYPAGESPLDLLFTIPPTTLRELAQTLKQRLGISAVRIAGDDDMVCRRAWLIPGSPPGFFQIKALSHEEGDVLVVGEINEWETCEYVRDSQHTNHVRGLIILGHAVSEEGGMQWLAEWLRPLVPDVPITHVPAGEPLRSV